MSGNPKANEWNLLKEQFDALVHEHSADPDIETIFDVEFRRRFSELISRVKHVYSEYYEA